MVCSGRASYGRITHKNTLVSHPCIGFFVSPNQPIFLLFHLRLRFLEAVALSKVHVLIDGSPRASRIGRVGPRRAPKCARDAPSWTLSNAYFILYFRITSFPSAIFCSNKLPSSSLVPWVLWYARGELVIAWNYVKLLRVTKHPQISHPELVPECGSAAQHRRRDEANHARAHGQPNGSSVARTCRWFSS